MVPAFNTPRGTVTTTASARKILEQPDCVEWACTSTPGEASVPDLQHTWLESIVSILDQLPAVRTS